ncbi:O-methyltransferase [Gloeophyllum trabeum ATCC 11539]|uniref:O-methyltransferase n=1 Tax=Gloeophyllum trabeum (strain ATCC 11539 / FP-39264 / Madison 617) TaxID=670483 RepID=S7RBG7_GLOTA|nr:O-methyltransferase [Gloeophyllum trabeum ATCC 11539]EPQ51575.1 O-methyltransferase [Gloeophyllum trabeum ATCC 11539]
MTIQDLKALGNIIQDSITKLEKHYKDRKLDFPSLDQPYTNDAADALTSDADVVAAVNNITAASYQLMSNVRPPFLNILDASTAYELSSCLRVAEQCNAAEILREAGPEGAHISIIAAKNNLEPTKLARIFRLLATHHIFREVKPDVFANNRTSSYIDTGKSTEQLYELGVDKHSGTAGAAAIVDHFVDEVQKASGYLWETLISPEKGHSFSSIHAPVQEAFNTDLQFFTWIEQPGNERRFKRYPAAIRGTSLWNGPSAILKGYDWGSLTSDDLIVDVGGGAGMPSMYIARANPNVKIVIQEREQVAEQGKMFWSETYPDAFNSGRVSFQVHEFFEPQPQKNASVFVLRTILHDWPDSDCEVILRHLRAAATPRTRLVIGDYLISYACPDTGAAGSLAGYKPIEAPPPLLANLGKASATAYALDMSMFTNFNGQERTLRHFLDLTARCGWQAIQVYRCDDSPFGFLVSKPM